MRLARFGAFAAACDSACSSGAAVREGETVAVGNSAENGAVDWGSYWVENGYGVRPTRAAEVLSAISRLAVLSASTPYVWRGVNDARFSVQPSVFRVPGLKGGRDADEASVAAYEGKLLNEASEWGVGQGAETFPTHLSALATIQHHAAGIPGIGTRLLDVSAEPLTPLWFATEPAKVGRQREPDGVVLAIRRRGLPAFGTHSAQRGTRDPNSGLDGGMGLLFGEAQGGPFVVRPEFPSGRMIAQNSLFVASKVPAGRRREGLRAKGIDGLDLGLPSSITPLSEPNRAYLSGETSQSVGQPTTPLFVAIVVPGNQKARLRTTLGTTYGRSEQTIYPDVQGFVDSRKSRA